MRSNEQQTEYIIGLRDEKLKERKMINRKLLAIIPSAACFCMVVAFTAVVLSTGLLRGCSSPSGENNDVGNLSGESVYSDANQTSTSDIKSESVPAGYRYGACSFNGIKYSSVKFQINASNVGEKLGTGKTYYGTGDNRKDISCGVYEINNISSEFAVALEYETEPGYYFTFNYGYKPQSLSDIYDDFGFQYYLSDITVSDAPNTDKDSVNKEKFSQEKLSALFKGPAEETEYTPTNRASTVICAKNNDVYGEYILTVTVFSDGYIKVNFCGINKFYKTDVSDFIFPTSK